MFGDELPGFNLRAGIVAGNQIHLVPGAIFLDSKAEGCCRISRICETPQKFFGRRRPGDRPIPGVLDRLAIALGPQLLDGKFLRPTRTDSHFSSRPIDVPIVADAQTNRLQPVAVGIPLTGHFTKQLAEPVFVLRFGRMCFVKRQVLRCQLSFLKGKPGRRTGRGENKPRHFGSNCRFEGVHRPHHVDVNQLLGSGPPRSRHSSQVNDCLHFMTGRCQAVQVHDFALDKRHARYPRCRATVAGHGMSGLQQFTQDITTDRATATSYQNVHSLNLSLWCRIASASTHPSCRRASISRTSPDRCRRNFLA